MPKQDDTVDLYRRTRNMWGMILAAAWIAWWWHVNSADEAAALASPTQPHGLFGWLMYFIGENDPHVLFTEKMIAAFLSSPLAFIVSHYFARWYAARRERSERAKVRAAQEKQLAEQAANLERVRASANRDALAAQAANERHELVARIGDIDSQLLIYETESDQERRTRMLLNLTQVIYELHGKYPPGRLKEMLLADSTLLQMMVNSLNHMRSLGLQSKNFYGVLRGFLPAPEEIGQRAQAARA